MYFLKQINEYIVFHSSYIFSSQIVSKYVSFYAIFMTINEKLFDKALDKIYKFNLNLKRTKNV